MFFEAGSTELADQPQKPEVPRTLARRELVLKGDKRHRRSGYGVKRNIQSRRLNTVGNSEDTGGTSGKGSTKASHSTAPTSSIPSVSPSGAPTMSTMPTRSPSIAPSRVPVQSTDIFSVTSIPSPFPSTSPPGSGSSETQSFPLGTDGVQPAQDSPSTEPSVLVTLEATQEDGSFGLPSFSPQLFVSSSFSPPPSEQTSQRVTVDVRIMPFTILYTLQSPAIVSDHDFARASHATTAYLKTYIEGRTHRFVDLTVTRTDSNLSPVTITFYMVMSFTGKAHIFFKAHQYLRDAFDSRSVVDLITQLRSFAQPNAFSTTTQVEFLEKPEPHESTEPDQVLEAELWATFIAGLVLCFSLCSVIILLRVRHRQRQAVATKAIGTQASHHESHTTREIDELLSYRDMVYKSYFEPYSSLYSGSRLFEVYGSSSESGDVFEDESSVSELS